MKVRILESRNLGNVRKMKTHTYIYFRVDLAIFDPNIKIQPFVNKCHQISTKNSDIS